MTVYVGLLFSCIPNKRWRYCQSCHLFVSADSKSAGLWELRIMADRLGLKRSWFQGHSVMPHYDLTKSKRDRAIALGAIPVDRITEGKHIRTWRKLK